MDVVLNKMYLEFGVEEIKVRQKIKNKSCEERRMFVIIELGIRGFQQRYGILGNQISYKD